MNREQKTALVEELSEQIRSAEAIFAVDYRGISVAEAADLRARLRDAETRFRVVKNSLTERASDQAGAGALKALLEGPTALAFVRGDAALAAKALSDAARTLGTLEFKGGMMNGSALTADEVRSIARLPARDVLHAQLVGTIAAPLSGLVRTLNALVSGLAIQLQQMAEKGLVGTDTPSASESAAEAAPASEAPAEATEAEAAAEAAPAPEAPAEAETAEPPAETAEAEAPPAPEEPADTAEAEAAEEAAPASGTTSGEAEAAEEPTEAAEEPALASEGPEQTETDTASDAEASEE
jgi:large subunit ribosomal protein L10